MKSSRRNLLIIAGCLCVFLCQSVGAQENDPELELQFWADERFPSVLSNLLPFEKEAKVSFRTYRDLYTEVLEYSCSISWKQDGGVEAVIRMADSVSLYDQMVVMHKKNPDEPIESIKRKLKVKEFRLTEKICPAVKSRLLLFGRLQLPVMTKKERINAAKGVVDIILHPTIYTFEASISGGSASLELIGNEHPFIGWAKATRRALEACHR
jgi:hypothetical protein